MPSLCDIPAGTTVEIVAMQGKMPSIRRFMDLGIIKGAKIIVKKRAPLGDPMEIAVNGQELSIRKDEAKHILVK